MHPNHKTITIFTLVAWLWQASASPALAQTNDGQIRGTVMDNCSGSHNLTLQYGNNSPISPTWNGNTYQFSNLPRDTEISLYFTPPSGYAYLFSLSLGHTNHLLSSWVQQISPYPVRFTLPSTNSALFFADLNWQCVPNTDPQQQTNRPESSFWRYSYDLIGKLIEQINPKNILTQLQYDNLNRITAKLLDDGSGSKAILTNSYDNCPNGTGRLCETSSLDLKTGSTRIRSNLEYNSRGQVVKSTTTYPDLPDPLVKGLSFTTTAFYDEAGRTLKEVHDAVSTLGIPREELITTYNRSQPVSYSGLNPYIKDLKYNLDGQLLAYQSGNNINTTFAYNPLNSQLQNLNVSAGLNLDYTYEPSGNLKTITDKNRSPSDPFSLTQQFTYDPLSRLQSVSGAYTASYTYDNLNNILTKQEASLSASLNYSANALDGFYHRPQSGIVAGTNTNYQYDALGNLLANGTHTYEYDAQNALVKATVPRTITPPPSPTPTLPISPTPPPPTSGTTLPPTSPTPPPQGDADGDSDVDLSDYQIWKEEYNLIQTTKNSDFNHDNLIDGVDYSIWLSTYQAPASTPTLTPKPSNTPKPTPTPTIKRRR